MKKIRFIINPHSGTGKKEQLPDLINSLIDKNHFKAEVCFTKAPGHATELAREAVVNNFDIVVAVGGDGSVNETASSLINSKTALGIIPTGSGTPIFILKWGWRESNPLHHGFCSGTSASHYLFRISVCSPNELHLPK